MLWYCFCTLSAGHPKHGLDMDATWLGLAWRLAGKYHPPVFKCSQQNELVESKYMSSNGTVSHVLFLLNQVCLESVLSFHTADRVPWAVCS
jgi:hypothetical protein